MSVEGNSDSTTAQFWFSSDDKFRFGIETADIFASNAVFRDCSAWYHIIFAFDATNATSADRMILYVNNVRQTTSTYTAPSNTDYGFNRASAIHVIGRRQNNADWYFNGYLADVFMVDGLQLAPSSFGAFDANGIWQPKAYTGTYGTNGFQLKFADNSNNTATTLGKDTSPNGNNWTPNNFQVSNTPYASYATGGTNVKAVFDGYADLDHRNFLSSSQVFEFAYTPGLAYSSKIEIWAYTGNATDGATSYQINNSGSYTNFSADGTWGWLTVATGSGTLTNLKYKNNANGTGISFIAAIRIDSTTILIDDSSRIDSLVDSPTNGTASSGGDAGGTVVGNYCCWNALDNAGTLANGNLDFSQSSAAFRNVRSTFAMSSGKWYWEGTLSTLGGAAYIGIGTAAASLTVNIGASDTWGYVNDGKKQSGNTASVTYGASYTTGDIIGVAFDADNGTLTFYKNGTSQGQAYSGLTSGPYFFMVTGYNGTLWAANFGQRAFQTAAPANHKGVCTANLPTPTILKGSDYFDTKLYTGNGSTQTISGLAFEPDFVWVKNRSRSSYNALQDIVRGFGNTLLSSNATNAEAFSDDGTISAATSNGFTVYYGGGGNTGTNTNKNNDSYVGWAWDAGTTTSSNGSGSITSTVRANASAGFSVVGWTGNGSSGATVGHGLGVTPGMVIIKNRDSTASFRWIVWHQSISQAVQSSSTIQLTSINNVLFLDTTLGQYNYSFDGQINGSAQNDRLLLRPSSRVQ
jgi:hypothetical protein